MAKRLGLAWMWLSLLATVAFVRADDALQIAANTPLVVLRVPGISVANVRAQPDPRSASLTQVAAGSTAVRATGGAQLYGDTWWVEVQTGGVVGWLNARFLGRGATAQPLQSFVAIDELQPTGGYAFHGDAYSEASVTSYDECARACVGDGRCVAIEYRSAAAMCRRFGQRFDVTSFPGSEIAGKAQKAPEGGWSVQTAVRFTRLTNQGVRSDGYRNLFAHSGDECAVMCANEARCQLFGYASKKRLCSLFDRTDGVGARVGMESGIRQAAPPAIDLTALATATSASVTKSRQIGAPVGMEARERFAEIADKARLEQGYASIEVSRQGRVAITLSDAGYGGAMHAAATPRVLEGTLNNLAVELGRTDRRILHLVFYAGLGAAPVIVGSSTHDTVEVSTAAAVALQNDIDGLAKLAGLSFDPLSLLKPLRR